MELNLPVSNSKTRSLLATFLYCLMVDLNSDVAEFYRLFASFSFPSSLREKRREKRMWHPVGACRHNYISHTQLETSNCINYL